MEARWLRGAPVLALGLAWLSAGCNLILGNDPHELAGETDATAAGDGGPPSSYADSDSGLSARDANRDGTSDSAATYAEGGDASRADGGAGSCAAPSIVCGSACVPSDTHNCSACGDDCTNLAHVSGAVSCTGGACAFAAGSCAPGWMDCDGNPADGCETDISQAATCGGCKTSCSGATPVCAGSGSTYACASGCPAATPTACAMTCVDTTNSATDCGACGNACTTTLAHAQAACKSGACTSTCNSGYTLCGGVCADVMTDTAHCGACGNDCRALPHVSGAASCAAGACSFAASACAPGWADCNGDPTDGCETDLSQAATCGACKTACPAATPVCSLSSSGTYACASGCPAATPTLCGTTCANTTGSASNCGACGKACTTTVANAQASCSAGACTFTCNPGYTLCDGACVDERSDMANCGACGTSCTSLPHVSGAKSCSGGACAFAASACAAGWGNCNGDAADGCETDLSQAATCGACKTACTGATPSCSGSGGTYSCVSGCPAGTPTLCGSTCVDETTNESNCGGCGKACTTTVANAQAACSGGACTFTCNPGFTLCDGACVDEQTDPSNCGGCGASCKGLPHVSGTATCGAGACAIAASACATGWANCNGDAADGCETDLSKVATCGKCTVSCSGGTPMCSGSGGTYSCVSGCPAGTPTLCGTTCVDTTSNASNCGMCGMACTTNVTGSQATCSMGACGFSCNNGLTKCNGACVDETSNSSNCGGCGAAFACSGGKTCQSSKCQCQSGVSHDCGGTCVSNMLTSSCGPTSCTACPAPQNATPTCNGTSCGINCISGYTNCGGTCINVKGSDNNNCGSCGIVCKTGTSCVADTCTCNATCGFGCCSGSVCNSPTQSWYYDGDRDGYGDSSKPAVMACAKPPDPATGGTYVNNNTDCCDTDPNAYPGSTYCAATPAIGCSSKAGGYDYNCNGRSDRVACCVCDPTSGQCSDGYPEFIGCTQNRLVTPDPTYGTFIDCGTLVMCTSDGSGGCNEQSYAPAGDTNPCAGQIDFDLSEPCGSPVLYTSIGCDVDTCTPSNPQYTAPSGVNQGCQ